ncbi:MAG: hypothetical protein J6V76_07635 [Bacteroidales bacterium]|nr:hypothetical protein [Bacteroidales bacterium]MBO7142963.1 hypothetical protein [Bacteroidales bacterium]
MDEFLNIPHEDFRKIISTVRTLRDVDFSYYSQDILMHRMTRSMYMHGVQTPDRLVNKLMADNYFADLFVSEIFVPTTEMFRDYSMWKFLEDNIVEKLKNETLCKIWIPQICGDDELYSLLVILHRKRILNRCTVYATSPIHKILNDAKSGFIDQKKLEISSANFKKIDPDAELTHYLTREDKYDYFSSQLLDNVIFLKGDIISTPPPDNGFNLVLFRDRMLYMNVQTKKMVVDNLAKTIVSGGYFIIGIRENLSGCDYRGTFIPVSKNENIFVKVQK